mmetsp:Transcript_22132/g.89637  ORF Transcript_22132/g.89637 Transcript_22132/m.89637 type:complete len:695 (-) Transcript_22132:524-2608(-)
MRGFEGASWGFVWPSVSFADRGFRFRRKTAVCAKASGYEEYEDERGKGFLVGREDEGRMSWRVLGSSFSEDARRRRNAEPAPGTEEGGVLWEIRDSLDAGDTTGAWIVYRQNVGDFSLNLFNCLLNLFGNLDSLDSADRVFRDLCDNYQPDHVTYNTLLTLQSKQGEYETLWWTYEKMIENGIVPTLHTYTILITAASRQANMELAEKLFLRMTLQKEQPLSPNIVTFNALLSGYAKLGDEEAAEKVADRMLRARVGPDHITLTSLMLMYLEKRNFPAARKAFLQLRRGNWVFSKGTYAAQIKYCALTNNHWQLGKISEEILVNRVELDGPAAVQLAATMIRLGRFDDLAEMVEYCNKSSNDKPVYGKHMLEAVLRRTLDVGGGYKDAVDAMDALPFFEYLWTTKYFNAVLKDANRKGELDLVRLSAQVMRVIDVKPSVATFTILLETTEPGNISYEAERMIKYMHRYKVRPDLVFFRTWLKLEQGQGNINAAERTLELMERFNLQPEAPDYSALMCECVRQKNFRRLFQLLGEMDRRGLQPDLVFVNELLNAFAAIGAVREAENFLQQVQRTSLKPDRVTYNTMIKLHARRGNLDSAERLLKNMRSPDRISYNTLVAASAFHNDFHRVHRLLRNMEARGNTKPDVATYTSIIGALTRAGEASKAKLYLKRMRNSGIQPNKETHRYIEVLKEGN